MNVILVIFDSLRKDCLGVYGSPPWGKVLTPHFDAFARESLVMTHAYPESLPTLPARRALYTGKRVYPFHNSNFHLKGDFAGAPGWGPIPEDQATLAEILHEAGYRTGLISDVFHMFKPSKNFWRGFDQWTFLRGKEVDPSRSGPQLTQSELDYWLPREMQIDRYIRFTQQCIMNIRDRVKEEDFFAPRVLKEASLWLEQNQDANQFFLTIESFDPHEPWLVPAHYRRMYSANVEREQVISKYGDVSEWEPALIKRTQVNYSAAVTLCDRWFGFFMESLRVLGLLENTMVILTSDHGHSICDRGYLGKRGYPSVPEVYDIPLLIRFPKGAHAGMKSNLFVQHHDISAAILDSVAVKPPEPIDGVAFIEDAVNGQKGQRDHVTVGWGSTPTVITERWWLNGKIDGIGLFLYDLHTPDPFEHNVAPSYPYVVQELFEMAHQDARGGFPEWLVDMARQESDAPGCSQLVGRK